MNVEIIFNFNNMRIQGVLSPQKSCATLQYLKFILREFTAKEKKNRNGRNFLVIES